MSRTWLAVAFLAGWLGVGNALWAQSFYHPGGSAPPTSSGHGLPEPPPSPGGISLCPENAQGNAFADDFSPPCEPDPLCWQFGADYLILWFRPLAPSMPLITVGNPADPLPGALGQAGTQVICGDNPIARTANSAGRFSAVYWLVDPQVVCLESNYWIMEQRAHIFGVQGNGAAGTLSLGRPFYEPIFLQEMADNRSWPGVSSGSATATFMTRMMGGEVNARWSLNGGANTVFSMLAGGRFLRLDDKYLGIDTETNLPVGSGNTALILDNITTYNQFVGGQLGWQIKCLWERFSFEAKSKLAIGPNFQRIQRSGYTRLTDQTGLGVFGSGIPVQEYPFGMYVQPSNQGTTTQQPVVLLPEFSFNVGCYLAEFARFSIGYNFLYLSDVVRPDKQFDHVVNPASLVTGVQAGPARPAPLEIHSSFWVQWLNVGLEFIF